jgi:1-acyl-sn-glycerol-3-phosphate acyltransferase
MRHLSGQFRRAVTNKGLKGLLDTLCNIDNRELTEALSKTEPLIVAINHINFLEVPILVTHSYPLYLTGLVKSETWSNPFFSYLFNTYKAIPIDRNGAYQDAFRRVREALNRGFSVCVAPEGTRSKDGILGEGKAGIVQLALYTNSPVLPVGHFGGQRIWQNMKHFKRTPVQFKAGRPFRINFEGRPRREERQEMLNEVMGQIARLLPEEMRGIYAGQVGRECKYLEFLERDD